jgi:hypothetical protein
MLIYLRESGVAEQDTPVPSSSSVDPAESPEDLGERKPERDRIRILGLLMVIVLAILLLFLIRGCNQPADSSETSDTRMIGTVPEHEPVAGAVSVWVRADTTIDEVLRAAAIESDETVDMGDGRFFVRVLEGTELESARALAAQAGVYDAGLVYEDDELEMPDSP